MRFLSHFINYSYCFCEQAAPLIGKATALACQRKPLARGAKGDDVYRREPPAVKLGDIAHMGHVREVPLCDGHALRNDLTGPQGADAIKRGGIGETAYAVEQGT